MKELMELSLIVLNCVKCYTVGAESSMAVSSLTANSLKVHTLILNLFCFITLADMRWFGRVVPLISMGKKTEKQPVYVSTLKGCCH